MLKDCAGTPGLTMEMDYEDIMITKEILAHDGKDGPGDFCAECETPIFVVAGRWLKHTTIDSGEIFLSRSVVLDGTRGK